MNVNNPILKASIRIVVSTILGIDLVQRAYELV